MARSTLISAAEERLLAQPVDAAYAVLADLRAYPRWWPEEVGVSVRRTAPGLVGSEIALDPRGGRAFALRVVEAEAPTRIALAYEGTWLEGEGQWTVRRKGSGALVRYEMEVRSDRWLVALAAKTLDLPALYSRQMHEVLEALEAEARRRASAKADVKARG
jgi:uncharacterized protein YndB with AHSA1/START domain